ncbi:hypothetical protein DV495_003574 [Geotrichum candidum]|uniref:Oxidase FUB9 n=1 Tax=Geotrichum candidum TaxID=1173061 RepID=A0A0J9X7A4_GEOCN|nr:hypothetical protein DV454_004419 [Geotrichum candidum]KAI9214333.1 hypothetical protein DS838_000711 [Geotrichum bryndzae]KAF5123073.1 hypothetical protein DV452_000393 [Geotrichum candidum]KAF5126456.1 hypothetical protein DV495_003574 [Geotrichum candidum]KAF7498272.1 hypothetical protein DV113_003662 [Geotrichum candidum]
MDMQSKPKVIASIADLEKASMPYAQKLARDYWQSGANEMLTVAENKSAFDYYKIRTKVMTDVSKLNPKPKTKLFGKTYSVPIGIAPSAFHQMATDEGEVATAKAALSRDVPMTLSSYSNKSLEDVKAAGGDSVVFMQLYVFQNRATTEKLVRRAEKAGYKALALTVDTPMIGKRFADEYNEFKLPGYLKLGNFEATTAGPIDIGMTPGSATKKAMAAESEDEAAPATTSEANAIDPRLNWAETIPWLRSITKLEIWAKGIATAEDTEAAIAAGIDGIWISNHGGRQLDSTLATIDSLPEVVEAAKGRVPVHIDGGFRRGGDVFKALALGADFVWLGRPVLYGLQYDGQKGLELALDIIREEFKYVMAMTGTTDTSGINRKQLVRIGPAIQKL